MTTEIDIEKIASSYSNITFNGKDEPLFKFRLWELQAFANEYMALSSSEAVGEVIDIAEEGCAPISMLKLNITADDMQIGTKFYFANPINQQLQTERDECVAEIRRLRKALDKIYMLTGCSASEHLEAMRNIYSSSKNALKAPASILKLLEK